MPFGFRPSQLLVIAAIVTMVISLGASVHVTGHPVSDSSYYRVFFADDPDPDASEFSIVGQGDLRWLGPAGASVLELSRAFDFYYFSTDPSFSVEETEISLNDFQHQQLSKIDTTTSSSRWFESSGGPEDGVYVKDLTVSLIDVERGYTLHAPESTADGRYFIPDSDVVYTLTDFRVDDENLPENYCTRIEWEYRNEDQTPGQSTAEANGTDGGDQNNRTNRVRVDGDQWCYRFSLEDPTVNLSLWLDQHLLYQREGPTSGIALVPYSIDDLTRDGELRVNSEVRITEVTIEQHRVWNRQSGWRTASESRSESRHATRVTDSWPVHVSSNQELSVRQRVIELGSGATVVVLEFDGPSALDERRIWSRATFEDGQELTNVWGVYSTERPHSGRITSNGDSSIRPHHFPVLLHLHVTARSTVPIIRSSAHPTPGYHPIPQVIHHRRERLGSERHEPKRQVNLTTQPIHRYDTVVIGDAPGPVSEVVDLHGEQIPLETVVATFRESELSLEPVNESSVQIRLFSHQTAEGLDGRIIHLSGSAERTVRTNDVGEATITPTRRFVTAEFRGDEWTIDQPVYQGPVRESVRIQPATASLMVAISEFWNGLQSIAVLVVLSTLGWLWHQSR